MHLGSYETGEIFNRVLTRKKYLCRYEFRHHAQIRSDRSRSRANRVGLNMSVLEEWIDDMGLPRGIVSHFSPVRDLLMWLQVAS
jgi:hypothetical protein